MSVEENKVSPVLNRHKGLPALVLGNAPSVVGVRDKDISDFVVFGVNRIIDLVDVDYLVMLDNAAERYNRKKIAEKKICTFMSHAIEKEMNVCRVGGEDYNTINKYCIYKRYVSPNPVLPLSSKWEDGLFYSRSSIVPAINLAYLMGCNVIGVLGVELLNNTHFYDNEGKDKEFVSKSIIVNDFKVVKNNLYSKKVSFFNLSPKTALQEIEYMDLSVFLNKYKKTKI